MAKWDEHSVRRIGKEIGYTLTDFECYEILKNIFKVYSQNQITEELILFEIVEYYTERRKVI